MRYALGLVMLAGCNQLFGIHDLSSHGDAASADSGRADSSGGGACSATQVDCDGLASNGCETDLDSDGSNCGACGHSCGGDACGGGECAVKTYFQSGNAFVPSLALFQNNLLWVDLDTGAVDFAPVDGSDTAQLAAKSPETPFWIVADDSGYVWYDNNGGASGIVFGCSFAPCGAPIVLASEPDDSGSTTASTGAIDGKNAYWHSAGASPSLSVVSRAGGAMPATVVANDGNSSNGMVVIGGDVYYTQCCGTNNGLYKAPIGGGNPAQVESALGRAIVAFGSVVYGADLSGNLVAYDTASLHEVTIPTSNAMISHVAVDASGIYVSIGDDTSGAIAVVDQSSGALTTLAPAAGVTEIVTDGNYVYWAENAAGGMDAVRRVHK